MATIIPQIGTVGTYTFKAPFDTRIPVGALTCTSVRTPGDVLNQGRDPYTHYYVPYDLTKDQYEADLLAGVLFIGLLSAKGDFYVVPTTYITSFPPLSGIPYSTVALAVNLGALPEDLDIDHVRQAVARTIKDALGVDPEIQTGKLSVTAYLEEADHLRLEAARQALVTDQQTDRAKYLDLSERFNALQEKYNYLVAYIEANP